LTAFIVAEVARTLGTNAENVPAQEDFRNLGIDSLMALELAKRLERRLGIPLNPALLALHPSIAELSPIIATMTGLVQPIDKPVPHRHP
jgi:acyl carrier protein